jgi:hypothetical protein
MGWDFQRYGTRFGRDPPETTDEHATLCPRNNQAMHALLIMISTVPPDACRSYWYEVEAAREDHHIEFGSYSQLLAVLFEKKNALVFG